jgi:acyl-CoA synthetase (AMP-forming)/AMP-acid ligase II
VLFVEKNERKIDFKEALAKSLPEYMLPTSTIILHEIPFNYNSKVDEKKLQELFLNKG